MNLVDYFYWKVHPSHRFVPADDNVECDQCACRPYNDEARQPCPEDRGHGGPR